MPTNKILQSMIILCIALFAIKTEAQAIPTFAESQTNITISARQAEFILKLKSNPTTGYSWSIKDYSSAFLIPVKHYYQPSASQLVGAGGFEMWAFKLKRGAFEKPQPLTISMMYSRPWEKKISARVVTFHVYSTH
jgi:inhibitor of cysteine peptidase